MFGNCKDLIILLRWLRIEVILLFFVHINQYLAEKFAKLNCTFSYLHCSGSCIRNHRKVKIQKFYMYYKNFTMTSLFPYVGLDWWIWLTTCGRTRIHKILVRRAPKALSWRQLFLTIAEILALWYKAQH